MLGARAGSGFERGVPRTELEAALAVALVDMLPIETPRGGILRLAPASCAHVHLDAVWDGGGLRTTPSGLQHPVNTCTVAEKGRRALLLQRGLTSVEGSARRQRRAPCGMANGRTLGCLVAQPSRLQCGDARLHAPAGRAGERRAHHCGPNGLRHIHGEAQPLSATALSKTDVSIRRPSSAP